MDNNTLIYGKEKNLGNFNVTRILPFAKKRNIGPFVFLDHMGPLKIDETHNMNVRPHPHIGLATVTYLFSGQGLHRDSLGSRQLIQPGDLNWMTAGRGIVHSERTPADEINSTRPKTMHGIQIWVALPIEQEECEPSFAHWPSEKMPVVKLENGVTAKLILGEFAGQASPVQTSSRALFMDIDCSKKYSSTLSLDEKEVGIFFAAGEGTVNGQVMKPNELIYISETSEIHLDLNANSRLIIVGGTPHPEPRYIWWNFVSSNKERIRQAAIAWQNQSMGLVEGEVDFIPLPDIPLPT